MKPSATLSGPPGIGTTATRKATGRTKVALLVGPHGRPSRHGAEARPVDREDRSSIRRLVEAPLLCASGPLGAPGAAFDLAREHRVSVDFESWLPKGFRVRSGPGSIQFETLHEHG